MGWQSCVLENQAQLFWGRIKQTHCKQYNCIFSIVYSYRLECQLYQLVAASVDCSPSYHHLLAVKRVESYCPCILHQVTETEKHDQCVQSISRICTTLQPQTITGCSIYDWFLNIYTYNSCQKFPTKDICEVLKVLHRSTSKYFNLKVGLQDPKFPQKSIGICNFFCI